MYTAYVLSEKARAQVLQQFPPKFPDVFAHHVTVQFGVSKDAQVPSPALVQVVGYISDESLEALVVHVDGDDFRADGKWYHITLSLDKSQGRKPVDSNKLLGEKSFVPVIWFEVETTPQLLK